MVIEYRDVVTGPNELRYTWVGADRWTPCGDEPKDFAAKNIFYGDGLLQWDGEQIVKPMGGLVYEIYVDGASQPEEITIMLSAELMLTGTHEIRIVTLLDGAMVAETVQTIVCANGEEDYNVEGIVINGAGAAISGGGAETRVGADGSFLFEVLEGTFDVTVKQPGYLTHTVKNVTPNGSDVDLGVITLVAGDVNGDNMINIMDMGAFRANFGKVGANILDPFTDVNGDGMVNIMDMGIFRANFGKTAAKDCTVEYAP